MQPTTYLAPEHLDRDRCLGLVGSVPVGRLGIIVGGRPEIYPVNHVVHEDRILFRTGSGTKLTEALGRTVAFEVDGLERTGTVWSVLAIGMATKVARLHDLLTLTDPPVRPWEPGAKPHLMQIRLDTLSGRRFPVAPVRPT